MTYHHLSAHTHCDQAEDDPGTALRILRRAASAVAVTASALGAAALAAGLWDDTVRLWNLGLAGLIVAAVAGGIATVAYVGDLVYRGRREDRLQIADLRDRLGEILRRLADLEAGERAIAGAMRSMSDPPDELGERRRHGGR